MEYRSLGRAGVRVSAVGVGCNRFGDSVEPEPPHRISRMGANAWRMVRAIRGHSRWPV